MSKLQNKSDEPIVVRSDERVAVFIDGVNIYSTAKAIGFELDYKKMIEYFEDECIFTRANYYTAMSDDPEEFSPVRPLTDWMVYNGYVVNTKPIKEYTDDQGRKRMKGSMEVEIAIDMLTMASNANPVDHMVLFSGSGNFRALVEAVQRLGVRVTVISSVEGAADDLRRQADKFIDLKHLKQFARPPREPREDYAQAR
jgi:uncharacterized LabA/DUF88 family protein